MRELHGSDLNSGEQVRLIERINKKIFELEAEELEGDDPSCAAREACYEGFIQSFVTEGDRTTIAFLSNKGPINCILSSAADVRIEELAKRHIEYKAEGAMIGESFLVRAFRPVNAADDIAFKDPAARKAFESLPVSLQELAQERLKNLSGLDTVAPPVRFFSRDDVIAASAVIGPALCPEYQLEVAALCARLTGKSSNTDQMTALKALRYFMNIDWNKPQPSFDLSHVRAALTKTHYGMEKVKLQLMRALAAYNVRTGRTGIRLHLTGAPGTGKSSLARSLAKALGLPCCYVSLNGVDDGIVLHGTSRNYDNGDCGKIVKEFYRIGSTRCVMILDEIDKMDAMHHSQGADPGASLLDLLDDSGFFTDQFVELPIDVSNVIFIATSNDASKVLPTLRDRMLEIEVPSYTREEKLHIARSYMAPGYMRELGLCEQVRFEDAAFAALVDSHGLNCGLRDIDRALRTVCNDVVLTHYDTVHTEAVCISAQTVTDVLGIAPPARGNFPESHQPGLVRALAVSANAGLSFPVEVMLAPEGSGMTITGLPSDVVTDSCKLALTNVRRYAPEAAADLHIHFGEGSVHKDGPSAGVSIFMAMLSAVLGQTVSANVAFTGEIDLFGNVFAVGGIPEKYEAAKRSGCEKMYIPASCFAQALAQKAPDERSVELLPVRRLEELVDAFFVLDGGRAQRRAAN